ncbi:hypothetical protein AT984_02165 [Paucibacter sp. KCTC 42545]|nr:hypothetical protein AT984_02165 [Paucibacter sp. KCTC 42545]
MTVAFNCAKSIESTILSITGQSYQNIEYIVIDGGSQDGTLDVIRKYDHLIHRWISEQDNGIYNAMNKGIDLSTGEWIIFMNAGDMFDSNNTIDRISVGLNLKFAVVAGGVRYIYDESNSKVKHMKLKFAGYYMEVPHHQASFINNKLMKLHKYDESFRIRGDLNFMTTLYATGQNFLMVDEVICKVETHGVSAGLSKIHITEEIRAGSPIIKNYQLKCIAYHAMHVIPRLMIRRILPKRLEAKIRSMVKG